MRELGRVTTCALVGVACLAAAAPAFATTKQSSAKVTIAVLSNRADLVSGGDALVRVRLPKHARIKTLNITVGHRDVTKAFTLHHGRQVTGLVKGLAVGRSVVKARLADGRGARLTITNHPRGGPVFAGPQVQPWICATEDNGLGAPLDKQCNAPTKISYVYQPEGDDPGKYKPYDPANPPEDVATTKTDTGRTVPYIVRIEEGTLDRTIYKIEVLADPAKPWTGLRPQKVWNGKLFPSFAGGCGTPHKQTVPNQVSIFGSSAADGQLEQPELLSRGWMVTGSGLNSFNQNCNEVVSAEEVMMIKEHIRETYGPIRHTVSAGGSGGSIQQLNMAAAYPGLLDGIVPTQTFPDVWQLIWDGVECYQTNRYFTTVSPELWLDPAQQAAVTGKTGVSACGEYIALFADALDPQNRGPYHVGTSVRPGCSLPADQTYNPDTNPMGVRCSVPDYQQAIWGHGGPRDAAPLIYDNTGVQYGLGALQRGAILPEQFVDLNAKIGSLDNEGDFTPQRASMDPISARTMYRAGRTTDPRRLADVPILDVREAVVDQSPDATSDLHQPYNSHMLRARLDAVNGTHANDVFWNVVPENMDIPAVLAVDRWLDAVERDKSHVPRAQKVIRDKPKDIVDTCWIDNKPVTDPARCAKQYPVGSDPRMVAGEPLRGDVRKCELKPLRREDYKVTFTDDQWKRLEATFPAGVCDWTRPSVGYQRSIPWMTYSHGPGGQPLGAPPRSRSLKRHGERAH